MENRPYEVGGGYRLLSETAVSNGVPETVRGRWGKDSLAVRTARPELHHCSSSLKAQSS